MLTKVLERGRLMSYLEQSTRYVPYTQRPGGRWKYVRPEEITGAPVAPRSSRPSTGRSRSTAAGSTRCRSTSASDTPRRTDDSEPVYSAAIRAKALDSLRGLLPAATRSNVGLYGSGQAFEALLLRMRAHRSR